LAPELLNSGDGRRTETAHTSMSNNAAPAIVAAWRTGLPVLSGQMVSMREPVYNDSVAIAAVLSLGDATRFGIDDAADEHAAQRLVDAAIRDRLAGTAFTFAIVLTASRRLVGLFQVRRLDPTFECGEWECTLAPAVRGSGVFVDAARLAMRYAFESVGIHRLETRVLVENGRANGAIRKLGGVHEGILRGAIRRGGLYLDQALWALLKDDWNAHAADGSSVH
jgi:RimJ/RimL family protein N-acetyltransferase